MAKKIRFPLEMDNGIEVRSVEELRDNFSLVRVLGYVENGKLVVWLRDRYANDLADAVEELNKADPELGKKISGIFDVPYDENTEKDLEKAAERIERLKRLKDFTDEQKYEEVIDRIAFDQDELYDLLDEGVIEIYLCGDRFSIPTAQMGVTYIGINKPIAVVDSKTEVNWKDKKISIERMIFDEKYQEVLNNGSNRDEHGISDNKVIEIGAYSNESYLNFMIKFSEQKEAEQMYNNIKGELEQLNYSLDDDIQSMKKAIYGAGLLDVASDYIDRL